MTDQFFQLAQILMSQGRFVEAEAQLRKVLGEDPDNSAAHALIGLCLANREEYAAALEAAKSAVTADPESPLGYFVLSRAYQGLGKIREAREAIVESIRLDPTTATSFSQLAIIEVNERNWKAALEAANQGLAQEPTDVACNNMRALALVQLGQRDEAGRTIDAALAEDPDNALTHANQGWAKLHASRPHEAMTHFREALRLDPHLEWAREGIVEAMKARNFIYRWMLAWFLWVGRLSPQVQILLMLGMVFGHRIMQTIVRAVPVLNPLAIPLVTAYILFVWMSWTASSLFNLVLMTDRFGRLVLSPAERLESLLSGACVLLAVVTSVLGLFLGDWGMYSLWGALWLGLMFPLRSVFASDAVRRWIPILYCLGLVGVIFISGYWLGRFSWTVAELGAQVRAANDPKVAEAGLPGLKLLIENHTSWLTAGVIGIALWTWIGSGLSVIPRRR